MVSRIRSEDLEIGSMIEKREHPWASKSTARKIARDHLEDNPKAYSGNKTGGVSENTTVVLNQNVKAVPAKKKKKVPKQQKSQWPWWIQY